MGTSGFSYKEWKGSFYPKGLPAKQMLRFYAERFGAVEINNSFYSMPKKETLLAWAAEVPKGFRFMLKAPQRITHFKRLKGAEEVVAEFLDVARVLDEKLAGVVFQLPPNMKKDLARLEQFLNVLPVAKKRRARGIRVAFEFRHDSWFDDEVYELLRAKNVSLCAAETDDKIVTPLVATADWGYVRLRMVEYTPAELKAWVKRIRGMDWVDTYVFFKHEDTGTGPKYAAKLKKMVGE
ncbi:MAG: DUF72 domain-containing protein [Pyrinomonadaceae bacterium]|nr:DUF72 domain-containing protein [Phycisphaerales bacterium]